MPTPMTCWKLFKHVGGLETIKHANHIIKPEYCEIDIYLPSKTSEHIQGFSLSTDIISQVESIKVNLGFGFF